jgi:hypothetical protein
MGQDPPSLDESALKSALKSDLGESDSESDSKSAFKWNPTSNPTLSGVGFFFLRVDSLLNLFIRSDFLCDSSK